MLHNAIIMITVVFIPVEIRISVVIFFIFRKTNKSDANWNAKWERDDKANTRSIANLVTDGFSERANEKSPQEHVFDKFISLTGDLGHDLCTRRGFQTTMSHSLWLQSQSLYFCFMTWLHVLPVFYWKQSLWRLHPRYSNKLW